MIQMKALAIIAAFGNDGFAEHAAKTVDVDVPIKVGNHSCNRNVKLMV